MLVRGLNIDVIRSFFRNCLLAGFLKPLHLSAYGYPSEAACEKHDCGAIQPADLERLLWPEPPAVCKWSPSLAVSSPLKLLH